ncbi:Zinc finger mynd domain-containing protein 19-like [Plakobranchus ocellatus]|uniref:Zinc finger mynd domain-containing protein 19-like n=1 Tax=Plakobranchus ocellatus TaxID=259542 RepID=A0AAV4BHH4_9GAST|nr:Zinc finger mynd domain-containing protein 19-like [Plakobranchus ocellatus]
MSGLKLGILRLGRVAGKAKYALIDERDISIVQQQAIEPRVEVDRNGNGARIYAIAHEVGKGRDHGVYLHHLLWEHHRGGVAQGWRVVHKNNVTVDNRLDNLELVKDNGLPLPSREDEGCVSGAGPSGASHGAGGKSSRENSLYWITVTQLLGDPLEMNYPHFNKWFDYNGDVVDPTGETYIYYECHYPPCTNMEREIREFSICGRCQEVRYCGQACQERDWPCHKRFCRERRRQAREITPDR